MFAKGETLVTNEAFHFLGLYKAQSYLRACWKSYAYIVALILPNASF